MIASQLGSSRRRTSRPGAGAPGEARVGLAWVGRLTRLGADRAPRGRRAVVARSSRSRNITIAKHAPHPGRPGEERRAEAGGREDALGRDTGLLDDHRKRKGGTKKPSAAGQASDLPPFASAAADAATNVRRVSDYPAEVESRCASPDKKKKRNQQDTSDRQDASLSVAEDLGPAELSSPPRTRSSGAHPDDSFVFGSSESNNAPLDDDDDDSDYNDSDYNDSERPRGGD
ncbi:hypothetical protein THAOC_22463 [Thalassiosira oceanica]|uniref:Uncharacterized protein n=1 Tax=Thalassiosira oceanica TaxID=159749 RepID=K0S986_THAOC|nr:hypothetical protein THAOC_22463 [Thalassiosira oceanica]|eukprot:EJK57486.1 hypothetical protein THAOC_22463 [Thalassiosira oceanica]